MLNSGILFGTMEQSAVSGRQLADEIYKGAALYKREE
jgi:hypothetical protein